MKRSTGTIIATLVSLGFTVVICQGIPDLPKLFTYARYNAELLREGLDELGLKHIEPAHVQQMDSVDHMKEMQEVGRAVAKQVEAGHFF